jgi:outer membrane receptor protein involved in Fe transport
LILGATYSAGNVSSSRCVSIESAIDDSAFNPQVLLRYRPSDVSLYVLYATSFMSGSFDMKFSTVLTFADDFQFGPEDYDINDPEHPFL